MKSAHPQLTVVVPAYNEQANVATFFDVLTSELNKNKELTYEILYVNDGSTDKTLDEIQKLAEAHSFVRLISFSRNFGKEMATSAGIHHAHGDAIIMIDADGQHPPELIHTFLQKWRQGNHVVIGVRKSNKKEGLIKKYGSKLFYRLFNSTTDMQLIPASTDFRLIDRVVQQDFKRLTERNRITRGLIDWIGYKKDVVEFNAKARMGGQAGYRVSRLIKLAIDSFLSLSLAPLYFAAWAGAIITLLSGILGLFILIEQVIMHDPLSVRFTGTAMLGVLIVFLAGLILSSQGLIALYVSQIHTEAQNRPIYIIDREASVRL